MGQARALCYKAKYILVPNVKREFALAKFLSGDISLGDDLEFNQLRVLENDLYT